MAPICPCCVARGPRVGPRQDPDRERCSRGVDASPAVPSGPYGGCGRSAATGAATVRSVRSCRRGRATGARVLRPSSHLAGQTSPGWAATYCAALILRSSSTALRPTPPAVISTIWILPSGSTTNVPRSARPSSSISTSKLRDSRPVGSPISAYLILPIASDVSCQALWREVGVGRHAVDLDAELLELGVAVGQVVELGRADEGEVGRIEEEDRPLALGGRLGDVDELAVLEGGRLERFDFGIDQRHEASSLMR